MKKNLKLLSGILMASFISNSAVNPIDIAKARVSRTVVVNSSSNNIDNNSPEKLSARSIDSDTTGEIQTRSSNLETKAGDDSSKNTLDSSENLTDENENLDESLEDEVLDESLEEDEEMVLEDEEEEETLDNSEEGTANILEILNSDENITMEDILELSTPISHSLAFIDEFKTTFPDLEPLREISPLLAGKTDSYLDVNLSETKNITKYLNGESSGLSAYSEQNKSNMLLCEIDRILEEINEEISSELPSTIFSLTPTLSVFEDTYRILSKEYYSVIENNSSNQITLNILLKDIEDKLSSLLTSINEFKEQLPETIETLNELAESFSSSSKNSSSGSKNNLTDDELEDEEYLDDELLTDEDETYLDEEENLTDEDETYLDEEDSTSEDEEEYIEEDYYEDEEYVEEDEDLTEEEEEVEQEQKEDPNKIDVYFGEQGQELIYDEKLKKYYQIDPEDPYSDDLIEYTGNVTKMTLAQYLNTELYYDDKGNELMYDVDTNSYFAFDEESGEFSLYTGQVVKKKIKDILEEENK